MKELKYSCLTRVLKSSRASSHVSVDLKTKIPQISADTDDGNEEDSAMLVPDWAETRLIAREDSAA